MELLDGRKMQRIIFLRLFFAVAAVLVADLVASADLATIGAAKDNTIFQSNVNNSLGAGQAIFAGSSGQTSPRRGLIQFDIAGSIPAGGSLRVSVFAIESSNALEGGIGNPEGLTSDLTFRPPPSAASEDMTLAPGSPGAR